MELFLFNVQRMVLMVLGIFNVIYRANQVRLYLIFQTQFYWHLGKVLGRCLSMNNREIWNEAHTILSWSTTPGTEFLAFMAEHYWGINGIEFLDLGSGTGASALFIANKGLKVTAVDVSDIACNKLLNNIEKDNKALIKVLNADVCDIIFECFPGILNL